MILSFSLRLSGQTVGTSVGHDQHEGPHVELDLVTKVVFFKTFRRDEPVLCCSRLPFELLLDECFFIIVKLHCNFKTFGELGAKY